MDRDLRNILNPGDRLRLLPVHGGSAEIWEILAPVGVGGSALCYEARCAEGKGRLKELYPAAGGFSRRADGSLHPENAAAEKLCEDFLAAYQTLENIRQADPAAELLNNFIPPCRLLRGENRGTVYVWTPGDKQGIPFEKYLRDAWKQPEKNPAHKLYNILDAVLTLTDCVRVLHRAGLLHLDIKPSNFLVLYDGDFNINPGSISLFDVNTLCPTGSGSPMAGSAGYFAPEVMLGRADNRSDLYSIGATLFRAVTNRTCSQEDYAQLATAVASSELLQASAVNANVYLRHTLCRILKKCLALRPAERYGCCEELIPELKQAKAFLLPEVTADQLGWQKKLAILDAEPQKNCSPAAVMQDLLFRDPPDLYLQPGEDTVRVLVAGAGTYGQKFMDVCLQACLLPDKKLHIIALSQNPELDKEIYFQIRPALPEFLERGCDGEIRLEFREMTFAPDEEPILRALPELCQNAPVHYAFIALGDDRRNRDAAALLTKAAAKRGMTCGIHYAQAAPSENRDGAVYLNRPITAKTIDPALKRLAWHAHISWADGEKEDLKALRRQFRKKYNLEASLAYALSIGSKLRGVGIFETDPQKAAAEFTGKILQQPDERFHRLVALEHRRWVLNKATAGWQLPRKKDGTIDLESGIIRGSMKNSSRRTHPCLVPSRADAPLEHYTKQQWDTPGDGDKALDALDALSLRQHRLCREAAEKLRQSRPLQQGELPLIRQRLAGAPEAVLHCFEAYAMCLSAVLRGSRRASLEVERRDTDLRESFRMLPVPLRRELTGRLDRVQAEFFPAVESNLYRDYKRQDAILIRRIPHILTGTELLQARKQAETEDLAAVTGDYDPQPLDTSGIVLPPELLELTGQLAANIHDVWAESRIREGWTYAEERSEQARTTPCLVPYGQLPDSEQAYDRNTALQTLKMITKLGWRILPPDRDNGKA